MRHLADGGMMLAKMSLLPLKINQKYYIMSIKQGSCEDIQVLKAVLNGYRIDVSESEKILDVQSSTAV